MEHCRLEDVKHRADDVDVGCFMSVPKVQGRKFGKHHCMYITPLSDEVLKTAQMMNSLRQSNLEVQNSPWSADTLNDG